MKSHVEVLHLIYVLINYVLSFVREWTNENIRFFPVFVRPRLSLEERMLVRPGCEIKFQAV